MRWGERESAMAFRFGIDSAEFSGGETASEHCSGVAAGARCHAMQRRRLLWRQPGWKVQCTGAAVGLGSRRSSPASTDVVQALGITGDQLRYAIEQGRITDCAERDDHGRRLWTMEEVERAVREFSGGT